MSVAGLERMTTGSAVSALSYRATQVGLDIYCSIQNDHLRKYMPPNDPRMRVAIISLFVYENNNFLFKIFSKYTQKHINFNMFSK